MDPNMRQQGPRRRGVVVTDPAGQPYIRQFTGDAAEVLDGTGHFNNVVNRAWPVGAIFIAAVATNPATLLGIGTWELFAQGRVLVGIDSGAPEFNDLLETGGAKTHVLTCDEIPPCP
jgi:hypothetical protein